MSTNLYEASKQWAERPADERFWTVQEMHAACQRYRESAAEARVRMADLSVVPYESDLQLVGSKGQAKLTHWSFQQLAGRVHAPAGYLRSLSPELAANAISYGLTKLGKDEPDSNVLFHRNGGLICRAFTSDHYARIWNSDVTQRLLELSGKGWKVPPARPALGLRQPGVRRATAADISTRQAGGGLSVQVGDLIAPAGLYASDHDMFAFLVNENVVIEDGSDGGLARGFFITNSEVGAAALKLTKFLYRSVCGNHIVWDVKDVEQLRIVHVGANDKKFSFKLERELLSYATESQDGDRNRVLAAKSFVLGSKKEEVLDMLFGKKVLPRATLALAYEKAIEQEATTNSGSPNTAWGFAQGVTALSQESEYTDERVALDRAAGRVLSISF